MTHRYLLYPLLLLVMTQLAPLWHDRRWYRTQIIQRLIILAIALYALLVPGNEWWTAVAWLLFVVIVGGPRWLLRQATRARRAGNWLRAAKWESRAGRVIMGRLGWLHRQHARALRQLAWDETDQAENLLEELAERPLPSAVRGMVWLWRLSLLSEQRAWMATVTFFEQVDDWGTLWLATRARLIVARAYAEVGALLPALRCLQFVAISPAVVRVEQLYRQTRVRLAAMAGDTDELERLLDQRTLWRRGFQRFAAYWRGRCALARGDRAGAIKFLSRAYALTHPSDRGWRQALRYHFARAETADALEPPAGQLPGYAPALAAVRQAEEQAAPWRALMNFAQPAPVTLVLLAEICLVFVVLLFLPAGLADRIVNLTGNGRFTIQHHQWWRLFTTLFLHANWLHLGFNGLALWMFGTAIERAGGWGRMLVIFFIGGALGNLLSATFAHYDLAVGASGGIFALLGAYGVAVYRLRGPAHIGLRKRLLIMLALMVAADLVIGGLEPQVDNLAHLGGFVAGIILGVLLPARRRGVSSTAS